MTITQADLLLVGAASMPDNDASTVGGVIDATRCVAFLDLSETGVIDVSSDNAGDTTQTLTIVGRDALDAVVTEDIDLNGMSLVVGTQSFVYVDKLVLDGAAAGTVRVRRYPGVETVFQIPPAVVEVRKPFYAAVASISVEKVFYEKLFFKNVAADTLNAVTVILETGVVEHSGTARGGGTWTIDFAVSALPTAAYYKDMVVVIVAGTGVGQMRTVATYDAATRRATMATVWSIAPDATSVYQVHAMLMNVEDAKNDNNSAANRLTLPTGISAGAWQPPGRAVPVPGGTLATGDRIGVWLRLVRPALAPPLLKATFGLRVLGAA